MAEERQDELEQVVGTGEQGRGHLLDVTDELGIVQYLARQADLRDEAQTEQERAQQVRAGQPRPEESDTARQRLGKIPIVDTVDRDVIPLSPEWREPVIGGMPAVPNSCSSRSSHRPIGDRSRGILAVPEVMLQPLSEGEMEGVETSAGVVVQGNQGELFERPWFAGGYPLPAQEMHLHTGPTQEISQAQVQPNQAF